MFITVAPRYDFINSLLSLGQDTYWRASLARQVRKSGAAVIADVATGSGRVAMAIAQEYERNKKSVEVVGYDFCAPLIDIAQARCAKKKGTHAKVTWQVADSLALPCPNDSVDAMTVGFGIRNYESRPRGYAEALRVLKPGGWLYILEFSTPPTWLMRLAYRCYQPIIPLIAKIVGAPKGAYEYLNSSVNAFPDAPSLAAELEAAGFTQVGYRRMSGGVVAVHWGRKGG